MSLPLLALLAFPSPAAQDDRTRILDGVESWYQVVQDGKNKGFVLEKLERVRDRWSYVYRADFEIEVQGGWHLEFRDVEAVLDEEFVPTTLQARIEEGRARVEFSIASEDDQRTLLLPGDRRVSLPDADLHALPTLLFYSLRQGGLLAKAGPRSARVLVPRAEGGIEGRMSFDIAEPIQREIKGKTGPVTPVRFLRPPAAAHRDAEWVGALVDKYGRLAEVTLRGGARFVLVEDDLAAFRGAVNVHRSEGLREPFSKDEVWKRLRNRSTPFPEEEKPRKVTADNLMSALADAARMLEDLRALKGDERAAAYLRLLREWKAIRDRAAALGRADAVARADELREGAEKAWDGAARAHAAALRSSVAALEAFDRLDASGVEREVRSLREARSRIELHRRPEQEAVLRLVVQAEPLLARARTRDELARKPVLVTGTVIASAGEPIPVEVAPGVRHDVRFVRDLSTAAINGRTYRVGEVLEGLDVRLEKVSTHGVTVSLRGELRDVPLGK